MDANELEKPLVIPLVKALTRAPTIVGVPYMYFMFEMVATSVIFLATHNLVNLLWMIPLHLFGYVMTLKDDRILRNSVRQIVEVSSAFAFILEL